MKELLLVLIPFLLSSSGMTWAQSQIEYGSNKGKYISISNTRIYYEEYGKGTPVLMLHGGAGSISDFKNVIPELAKQFRIVVPDSPGHGRSEQTDSLSYPLLADYFLKFIDVLKLDSVYVIGWSDGGITAFLMAADRPDKVKRVIASGAQFGRNGYTEAVKQMLGSITPEIVEKDWGSWVKDYQAKAPKGNNWKDFIMDLQRMWNDEILVPADKVNKIKSRTLIILGDRDAIKLEHGIEMYNSIKGSELLILPNTTHFVFSERPVLFNEIGIEFLKKK